MLRQKDVPNITRNDENHQKFHKVPNIYQVQKSSTEIVKNERENTISNMYRVYTHKKFVGAVAPSIAVYHQIDGFESRRKHRQKKTVWSVTVTVFDLKIVIYCVMDWIPNRDP